MNAMDENSMYDCLVLSNIKCPITKAGQKNPMQKDVDSRTS
jgi:hypothetical protein